MLYQQSWDANLGALRENNNRYEVRAYIAGTTNNYATPRIYTTGWTKYFDNIYEAANDLELGGTKKKRAMAVIHSANLSTTLSQLGGDYYKTSDGYLGVSENHIFDELQEMRLLNKYSYEKFIPKEYLYSDVNTRIELLSGLIDSDGEVNGSLLCYSSTSKQLSLDIKFLIDNGYVTQKIDQLRKNILPKKDRINDFEIIRGWRDSPCH